MSFQPNESSADRLISSEATGIPVIDLNSEKIKLEKAEELASVRKELFIQNHEKAKREAELEIANLEKPNELMNSSLLTKNFYFRTMKKPSVLKN